MNQTTALLARPHPVIVDAMRDVLIASGLAPQALTSRDELLRWPAEDVALVVVSTSVHSTVKASFEDVIRAARERFPSAVLVIGTVVEAERARELLSDMLPLYHVEGRLHTAQELGDAGQAVPGGGDMLVVNSRELAEEAGRSLVMQAIARLLGPSSGLDRGQAAGKGAHSTASAAVIQGGSHDRRGLSRAETHGTRSRAQLEPAGGVPPGSAGAHAG